MRDPFPTGRRFAGGSSVLAGLVLGACCVTPPSAKEFLAIGFRTPEQAFKTFQIAVRADDPSLEYRCFSSRFLAANHVSKLAWREYREQLAREHPFLKKGLADAEIRGTVERHGDRARLVATSHGVDIRFDMVLDDFTEVWTGKSALVDESVEFGEHAGIQTGADGRRWIYGRIEIPPGPDLADVTELRLGREWKIDGLSTIDENTTPSTAGARPTSP